MFVWSLFTCVCVRRDWVINLYYYLLVYLIVSFFHFKVCERIMIFAIRIFNLGVSIKLSIMMHTYSTS